MDVHKLKLDPLALGLALGVLWGVSVFILGLLAYYFSYGVTFVLSLKTMYIWYGPTILGSLIGGFIAFVDAFIGGVLIAWLYNCFSGCCCKKS